MPETKITSTNSIGPSAVDTDAIIDDKVTSSKLSPSGISPPSVISAPQLSSTLDLSGKTVTFSAPQISPHAPTSQVETNIFNIGLLGFKMAVNEGLTVYNLVDGVVDEFNDETGVDTPENSNAIYDSTSDFYSNQVGGDIPAPQVGRQVLTGHTFSNQGEGTYTVESGVTAVDLLIVGGGGGGMHYSGAQGSSGAGGGGLIHVTDYEVTPGATISYIIGSGGDGFGAPTGSYYAPNPNFPPSQTSPYPGNNDGTYGSHAYSFEGGSPAPYYPSISPYIGTGVWNTPADQVGNPPGPAEYGPGTYADTNSGNFHPKNINMRNGRDTIWNDGQPDSATTTDESPTSRTYFSKLTGFGGGPSRGYADGLNTFGGCGGGGSTLGHGSHYGPLVGGEGVQEAVFPAGPGISPGAPEEGDMPSLTGNVVGSFGSDGGNGEGPPPNSQHGAGGGGTGEAGTSGASGSGGDGLIFTLADGSTPVSYGAGGGGSGGEGGNEGEGGDGTNSAENAGTANRGHGAGGLYGSSPYGAMGMPGGSGTIIVVESRQLVTNTSLTLISDTFTANTTPTKARIVVFAELPDGTGDFAVSATRDNTTFNAITLTDEGFETGSSGTKIFTGSTPLTGTASPQVALRWKIVGSSLTGANKIHGVALQWA